MGESVRLIDSLARRRLLYPSPVFTAPSVMLIDNSAARRTQSLPLGRYYFSLLETDAKGAEFERFLVEPRPALVAQTVFGHRSSLLETNQILISRYEPPLDDWSWILVCRWPTSHVRLCPVDADDLARGAYSVELYEKPEEMEVTIKAIIAQLGEHHQLSLRLVTGDMPRVTGSA